MSLEDRIDDAFKPYYSTVNLVKELWQTKRNINEFVLLVCARLDSLSNLAFNKKTQKEKFTEFLQRYSGLEKSVMSLSIPDLYFYLCFYLYILPVIISKPGRLSIMESNTKDEKMIELIWKSGLPITQKDIRSFIIFIAKTLQKKFRATFTQSKSKHSITSLSDVCQYLLDEAKSFKKGLYIEPIENAKELFKEFTIGNILYSEYRCNIIHNYNIAVDQDKFYQMIDIYWRTRYNMYVEPFKFLEIQFPAKYLFELLVNSIESYKTELKRKKSLPMELFLEICNFDTELGFLDKSSMFGFRDLNLRIH